MTPDDDTPVAISTPCRFGPASIPGSVRRPCIKCGRDVWLSPSSVAIYGEKTLGLCVPCYVVDPPAETLQPLALFGTQIAVLWVVLGRLGEDQQQRHGDTEGTRQGGDRQEAAQVAHNTPSIGTTQQEL